MSRAAARRALVLAAWFGVLILTIVGLAVAGRGELAPPPLTEPGQWSRWADQRQPASAAIAIVRLIVLGLAWYLLVATSIGVTARLLRAGRVVTAVDALSIPAVRHLVNGAVGLSLATGAVVAATAATGAVRPEPAAASAAAEESAASGGATMRRLPADGDEGVTMQRLPDADPTGSGVAAVVAERTAQPGDHLWSIAESVLSETWGRAPTDDETAPYWRTLVEANRDRLADRDNPDLIFPGQQLRIPEPPSPG